MYFDTEIEVMALTYEVLDNQIQVYNFEVEDWHTYFVSNSNILVHNTCKYIPKNISVASDRYLEKLGIDAHALKYDILGKRAKIAQYDIYIDKDTGQLYIYLKGGKWQGIPTGEYIK